jgi:hypothetical protein
MGNDLRYTEMLRADEDKTTRLRMFIDFSQQIAYQPRCLLDLVEDGTLPVFRQKSPSISLGKLAFQTAAPLLS